MSSPTESNQPVGRQRRADQIEAIDDSVFDVFIIGGGINGAVAAAALSGRGAKVGLVDRGDFAGFTSSASSNLVWGGFKYLENYEFKLVRDLCVARNRMIEAYPTQIEPIGFLAALDQTSPYPPLLAGLGTVGYWMIGSFKTRPPALLSPKKIKALEPVVDTETVRGGIRYDDAYLRDNDARFVFSFVRSALNRGANAANYVSVERAERVDSLWRLHLRDTETDKRFVAETKVVINAAGPFVDGLNTDMGFATDHRIAYSKGIHLVVPKLATQDRVLAFFDDTQRLFYVIPMEDRSVIGTTDTRTEDAHDGVTDEDRRFVLEQINARLDLETPLTEDDIISERVGVRPLVVESDFGDTEGIDWTSLSRKHEIEHDDHAKVISVFGGKLTDCINVGEELIEMVHHLGVEISTESDDDWFGEPTTAERDAFLSAAAEFDLGTDRAGEPMAATLWRRYGRRAHEVLDQLRKDPSLATSTLTCSDHLAAELPVIAATEMVVHLEDFLRRRSKIAMLERRETIAADPGFNTLAEGLFGADAADRIEAYRQLHTNPNGSVNASTDRSDAAAG